MNKRTWLIIGGAAAVLMLCACVAVAGFVLWGASKADTVKTELEKQAATAEVLVSTVAAPTVVAPANTEAGSAEDAANVFLRYLGSNQYSEAVAASTSDLRSDANTESLMREIVEDKGLQPQSWEWTKTEVSSDQQRTKLSGSMTYADGRQGPAEVELSQENGRWMVNYMDLKANGDTSEEPALNTPDLAQVSADVFMQFWQEEDYDSAFAMGSQAFAGQVGTPDKLKEILGGTGLQVKSWTWDSYDSFKEKNSGQQVIEWKGTAQFQDSLKGPVTVQLVEEDGSWMVLFFDVKTE